MMATLPPLLRSGMLLARCYLCTAVFIKVPGKRGVKRKAKKLYVDVCAGVLISFVLSLKGHVKMTSFLPPPPGDQAAGSFFFL